MLGVCVCSFLLSTVCPRSLAADGVIATALSEGAVGACVFKNQQLRVCPSGGFRINLGFLEEFLFYFFGVCGTFLKSPPLSRSSFGAHEKLCFLGSRTAALFSLPTSLLSSVQTAFWQLLWDYARLLAPQQSGEADG